MKLFLANPGEAYKIIRIGGREKLQKQLMNLGFVPGSRIRLVNEVQGNFIVIVKDTRLGISRELAQKIEVAVSDEEASNTEETQPDSVAPIIISARP